LLVLADSRIRRINSIGKVNSNTDAMAGCEDLEDEREGFRKKEANFRFKHAHSGAFCGVAVLKAPLKRPREMDKKKPLSLRKHGQILLLSFRRS
jgi:hypothetical protein